MRESLICPRCEKPMALDHSCQIHRGRRIFLLGALAAPLIAKLPVPNAPVPMQSIQRIEANGHTYEWMVKWRYQSPLGQPVTDVTQGIVVFSSAVLVSYNSIRVGSDETPAR